MNYFVRREWDLPFHEITDQSIYDDKQSRRDFVKSLGIHSLGFSAALLSLTSSQGCKRATIEDIDAAGEVTDNASFYPAKTNAKFDYGRDETLRRDAAEFTNFYEFSTSKAVYQYVGKFQPTPWSVDVGGLCNAPRKWDLDDIYKEFPLEERAYRHRCVETWAMTVPWTGFQLSDLLQKVDPKPSAKFVKFTTFFRPEEAANHQDDSFPWAYTEGMTIEEAMNPLTFLATGIYDQPLPKQHGAPIRLVIPWKYGFKSIKSIVKIELTDTQPATFWNTVNAREYAFEANVDPEVPHPRWSQATEWMLGTRERFPTTKYNGYGEYVASLYE
ncbi:UNVERIFIED_CONTAM: hypothetical protein GTU68_011115 [Idotea baltica]|nr:hypothetical protein [Idotea baltica]